MRTRLWILAVLFCFLHHDGSAQSPSKSLSALNTTLQEVILNHHSAFRGISGELLIANAEYEHHSSMVELPGAESCLITKYPLLNEHYASWQAIMITTESFEAASEARNH